MNKNFYLISLFLIGTVCSLPAQADNKHIYTMGVVPQFEIRHIRKIWNPILKEVKKNTGYNLKLIGSPTIPDFENEFNTKFTQSDSGDTRQVGGTVLGLNISKMIIEKLGGKIGFNTIIDKETTFYFELPIYNNN